MDDDVAPRPVGAARPDAADRREPVVEPGAATDPARATDPAGAADPVGPADRAVAAAPGGAADSSTPASDRLTGFDASLPWRRARSVALRPEPFGALVYHFGTRKLSFLKSRTLVDVVESLGEHPTAAATLAACGVPDVQRPAYERALADLARSQTIERRPEETAP